MASFTSHLLTQHADLQASATTHPFLTLAGRGTLPAAPLSAWLVQDKFYQFAYVQFIGRLISKVDLGSYDLLKPGDKVAWDAFTAITGALNAIKTEIEFYDQTVEKYGLKLQEADGTKATEEYVRLFEESSEEGVPLVLGLTVLWATEHVYLQAWSHAKSISQAPVASVEEHSSVMSALQEAFIPNWTSPEFTTAVEELARLVDAFADSRSEDTATLAKCEKLWERVLQVETEFWPIP